MCGTNHAAVIGAFIGFLVLIGNVETTWTFSAFTVLIYYALTNLAALRLKPDERLFPAWVSVAGWAHVCFWRSGSISKSGFSALSCSASG